MSSGFEFVTEQNGHVFQIDLDRLITESRELWLQWDQERKTSEEEDSVAEATRGLRFWRPAASASKVHLSDIERLLRIIRKEKWLGQTGVQSLQKMAVALLETIDAKNTLIETLAKENKTRGSRLRSLVRHASGEVHDEVDIEPKEDRKKTPPPEIEFEQPRLSTASEDGLVAIANVKLKRNKRC